MDFRMWLNESEEAERLQAFERYSRELTAVQAKYGLKVAPAYLERERAFFMSRPIDELRRDMAGLEKEMKALDDRNAMDKRQKDLKAEREANALETDDGKYYLVDCGYGRIVCSHGDPGFDKAGMPAFDISEMDPGLKGYYGVHVGSHEWLGILKRDDYCDGDAYLYHLDADAMVEDGILVYEAEDPHIMDRTETPGSNIIFSKLPVIPAQYVRLTRVVKEGDIKEAPPPYGMDYDGPFDGDDDSDDDDEDREDW